MAGAFGMDEAGMSARLEQLVEQGEIVGKLDGVDGVCSVILSPDPDADTRGRSCT